MVRNNRYEYAKMTTFTKQAIGGLTKLFNSARFSDAHCNRERVIQTKKDLGLECVDYSYPARAQILHFAKARKITAEQTKFGKAWLRDYFFKLDGSVRSGKRTESVSDRVLSIAKTASRFEFIGVLACENQLGEAVQYLPIYRTYNRKGEYFDYSPVHWGTPVIMEHVS